MNKFEVKAFECELLGELYNSLENRKNCYKDYDWDTGVYSDSTELYNIERIAIIEDMMKKIEKLI